MKRANDKNNDTSAKKSKPGGWWQNNLLDSMNDPNLKVFEDEWIVVIKDKYPKAKFHYLVLPKRDVKSLSKVTKDDLDLLKLMDTVGRVQAAKHGDLDKFRFGYHAVPSLSRLHMHVISEDFDSPCLKTIKHWNSFTTDFFLNSADVIKEVEENGSIHQIDDKTAEALMKNELKCHKCKKPFSNMPQLKNHLTSHKVWDDVKE